MQVIIQFEPLLHKALGVELMTRARNKFVFVVSQEMGSNASPELVSLLEEACDHGQEEGFVCRKHGQGCGFVGRMLVRREVLGEQVRHAQCKGSTTYRYLVHLLWFPIYKAKDHVREGVRYGTYFSKSDCAVAHSASYVISPVSRRSGSPARRGPAT